MNSPMPVLYTKLQQYQPARELIEAARVLLERAEKYQVIPTDADAEVVSEFRARLNHTIGKLDEERLAATAELRKLVASMNAEAEETLAPMRKVLASTDTVIKAFIQDRDRRVKAEREAREAEERRLQQERDAAEQAAVRAAQAAAKATSDAELEKARTEGREAMARATELARQQAVSSQAVVSAPVETGKSVRGSHGSSTGLRDNWLYRVTDISLVPELWLLPPEERLDKRAVSAHVKAKKDKTAIPGIEVYNDPIPNSRVAR